MARQKKTLQELTIKHNFIFGTAMVEDPGSGGTLYGIGRDDLKHAIDDEIFCEQLYEEYNIE